MGERLNSYIWDVRGLWSNRHSLAGPINRDRTDAQLMRRELGGGAGPPSRVVSGTVWPIPEPEVAARRNEALSIVRLV